MTTQDQAKASPTKAFFVQMLVKDVSLESAILDLVDNCIDGATRLRGDGSYAGLWVKVTVNRDEFVIDDNCGGIDVDLAKNYAFRFGRDPALTTVREGARLMGYPDWMTFHRTNWHGYLLVGNGVPRGLGTAIARRLLELLNTKVDRGQVEETATQV